MRQCWTPDVARELCWADYQALPIRGIASSRYRYQHYDNPWELRVSRKLTRQWDPRVLSL